jgi:signal transduction histidine kinase
MSEKILFESRAKLFDELERIAPLMPTPIYWLDKNYVIMGGNDVCLNAIGSNSKNFSEVLAAKTYYDYYPKKIADELTESIRVVLETNQATKTEERIVDVTTGKFRYYETGRAPLHDDKGELVGTICSAIEITAQKEAEHLRSEKLEEQEKFVKTVMQVVHDIRSPLMIIDILSEETSHFPEEQRVLLRNATQRINDITSNLLNTYKSTHQFGATQELPLFVFRKAIAVCEA